MTEPVAWVVAVGAGLTTLFGIHVLTRPMRDGFLKAWLRSVPVAVMFVPAPVPGFDTYYAPAFLVALFEAALQPDGQPGLAAGLLLGGIATITLIVWGYCSWKRRWRVRRQRGPEPGG